ncbi:MAG: FecR domain-containing protein [Candidatus Wallbacteria bacterium]
MPPKLAEMKVLSDADRRKMQKQRENEKKQVEIQSQAAASKFKLIVIAVSVLVVIVIAGTIFFTTSQRNEKLQQKEARQLEIKNPSGEIITLDSKTNVWSRPSENKLVENDGIRTGKNGKATLSFIKNRSVRMSENSEIIVKSIAINPDKNDYLDIKLDFNKGSAIFDILPNPSLLTINTPYFEIQLPKDFGALFKVVYGQKDKVDFVRVAVKTGRVRVMNKQNKNVYDVEALNELIVDKNLKFSSPQRFSVSSEVF